MRLLSLIRRSFLPSPISLLPVRRDGENAPLSGHVEGQGGGEGVRAIRRMHARLRERELGHEPAEGWGRKIANGYENERGERTSIAIASPTFARSPTTRVVVNKRGDEGALLKRRTRFFSTSLSLFLAPFYFFFSSVLFSRFIIAV